MNWIFVKLLAVVFVLGFFVVMIALGTLAEEETQHLVQGKNLVQIDGALYVQDLVAVNPAIEAVSYIDPFLDRQFAYVNVFEGIGSNFLIRPEIMYEIIVSYNTSLVIP